MTLSEAIDQNVELKGELDGEWRTEKATAVQLGIEALEAVIFLREFFRIQAYGTLPGETEEVT